MVYLLRGQRLNFPQKNIYLSLKIDFAVANSADADEMPHYVTFHLGLHCLLKYMFSLEHHHKQIFD